MANTILQLIQKIFSDLKVLVSTKNAPAYEMDDGPLSSDYIATLNAEAKKFIPKDEQPIKKTSLF